MKPRARWTRADDGTEPSLRGIDLDDDAPPRPPQDRDPGTRWDHPSRSPSVLVFSIAVVAIVLLTFAALELGEWVFGGLR